MRGMIDEAERANPEHSKSRREMEGMKGPLWDSLAAPGGKKLEYRATVNYKSPGARQ